MIFWTNFTKYLYHDSIGLIITYYLIVRSSSSFSEGKSDSQFLDVKDVNIFTGLVVEQHDIRKIIEKIVFCALSNSAIRILLRCSGAEIYRFLMLHSKKIILYNTAAVIFCVCVYVGRRVG